MNVRFEGNNGHEADVTRCLLMIQKSGKIFRAIREREGGGNSEPYPNNGSRVWRHRIFQCGSLRTANTIMLKILDQMYAVSPLQ